MNPNITFLFTLTPVTIVQKGIVDSFENIIRGQGKADVSFCRRRQKLAQNAAPLFPWCVVCPLS